MLEVVGPRTFTHVHALAYLRFLMLHGYTTQPHLGGVCSITGSAGPKRRPEATCERYYERDRCVSLYREPTSQFEREDIEGCSPTVLPISA